MKKEVKETGVRDLIIGVLILLGAVSGFSGAYMVSFKDQVQQGLGFALGGIVTFLLVIAWSLWTD